MDKRFGLNQQFTNRLAFGKPGTYTFVVPEGVGYIKATVIGGGGGGGDYSAACTPGGGGFVVVEF